MAPPPSIPEQTTAAARRCCVTHVRRTLQEKTGSGRLLTEQEFAQNRRRHVARTHLTCADRRGALAVSDIGTGISLQVAARAFEPFFTTKELASGTGLGLSTVHGIITQAGGTVILTSEPGVGTTFHIFIPATAAPAVLNVPAPAPRPTTPPSTSTILVADDEPAVLQATTRILQYGDEASQEAARGYEALTLMVASNDFQVFLTGSPHARHVRHRPGRHRCELRPGLPILHMTGFTPPHLGDERIFIQKPFTAETLLSKVREMLETQPAR